MYADYQILAPAFGALIGLLLGSFLNVCIYRVPRDLSVVFPRSHCPECGAQISALDNIPILSYFLLRRRCRSCGHPISWRYPAVEFTTAVLLACVLGRYGWSLASLKWSVFECLMVVLFWTDLEERILPREFTFGGALAGMIFAWFVPLRADLIQLFFSSSSSSSFHWISVADAAIGALFFAGVFWGAAAIWSRLAGREAMGRGDVHLLLLLGAFLGFERELPALTVGTVAGSVVGAAYVLIARKQMRSFELPLGSFLCAGAAVVPLFFQTN